MRSPPVEVAAAGAAWAKAEEMNKRCLQQKREVGVGNRKWIRTFQPQDAATLRDRRLREHRALYSARCKDSEANPATLPGD